MTLSDRDKKILVLIVPILILGALHQVIPERVMAGVGFDNSSSRLRASAAHGEALSRCRYSVHAALA